MPRFSSAVRSNSVESSDEEYGHARHTSRHHSSSSRHTSSFTSRQTLPPISSIGAPPTHSHREQRSAVHSILNPVDVHSTSRSDTRESRGRSTRDDGRATSSRPRDDISQSNRHRDTSSVLSSHREYTVTPGAPPYQHGHQPPSLPTSGSSGGTSHSFGSPNQYASPGILPNHMTAMSQQMAAPGPGSLQNAYRSLTLETDQGAIEIPVDVVGASRMADEKRRRNASASARFRARKKEKEQASTKEIDDMKQQIQDLGEDAEFYRQERDYLVGALYNTPEGDRHFPRRPSPRQYRVGRDSSMELEYTPGPSVASDTYSAFGDGEHGDDARYTRRRLASSDVMSPAESSHAYGQPTYTQMSVPQSSHQHAVHIPPMQTQPPAPSSSSSRHSSSRHHSSRTTTERSSKDSHRTRR